MGGLSALAAGLKRSTVKLTDEQRAFIDAVRSAKPGAALALGARAGTGKTFTLERAVDEIAPDKRVLVLVYNRKNRKELESRMPSRCTIHTFHSYCAEVLRRQLPVTDMGVKATAKTYPIMKEDVKVKLRKARWPICQGVALAKNLGFGVLVDEIEEHWQELFDTYDIRIPNAIPTDYVIGMARKVFRAAVQDKHKIDFDDMLYYVARDGLPKGEIWDYVLVDEAQDVNPAQLAILDHLMANGSTKLIFVGDPFQAIYGWRGAGIKSFEIMVDRYVASEHKLTMTWRCDRRVVEEAQRLVEDLRARPDAGTGVVSTMPATNFDPLDMGLGAGDVVLCRNNAPLLRSALACVEQGLPVVLLGRNITNTILNTINYSWKRWPAATRSPEPLRNALKWAEEQFADRPMALSEAKEEIECAKTMHRFLAKQDLLGDTLADMLAAVQEACSAVFGDDHATDRLVFSTIHRAKGLEWDRVYALQPDKIPSRSARMLGGWHMDQELNLLYVMITRAKHSLTYVGGGEDPVDTILAKAAAAQFHRAERGEDDDA